MSDSVIAPSLASIQAAYGKGQVSQAPSARPQVEPSFGDLVEEATQTAITTIRQGDQVASAGLAGQADMQAVVEATMAMESTVRVSVALRDKMVEAYQEILRMPI